PWMPAPSRTWDKLRGHDETVHITINSMSTSLSPRPLIVRFTHHLSYSSVAAESVAVQPPYPYRWRARFRLHCLSALALPRSLLLAARGLQADERRQPSADSQRQLGQLLRQR